MQDANISETVAFLKSVSFNFFAILAPTILPIIKGIMDIPIRETFFSVYNPAGQNPIEAALTIHVRQRDMDALIL